MKKLFLLISISFFIACSGIKRTQKALYSGDYREAIDIAVRKLQKDKTKKNNEEYIFLLQDAFKKFTEEKKQDINHLRKEKTNAEDIYTNYTQLAHVQRQIKPLLPLHFQNGKEAKFKLNNYSEELITAKNNYAEDLYNSAQSDINKANKLDYRKAHSKLSKVSQLKPNYKNTNQLLDDAQFYGTDFVFVSLENQTNQIIPRLLEEDLLNFDTYSLNDRWTVFHDNKENQINYNYEIYLDFKTISIIPERIVQKEIRLEREIKDGYTYKKNRNGDYILDDDGNKIKVDQYITVSGDMLKTEQSKGIQVVALVEYFDTKENRVYQKFPLKTTFVFGNEYARFNGNKKVLNTKERQLLSQSSMPFPSNEQMLLDAGNDLKYKFSEILKRNHL
ncbi:hypothetical protein RBU60_02265 [Mesonia sp. MT50]|uniref:Lipoprotein n=1 Tax=Mesonia profundi TaxID=3070998 RepID=A0ABU0ZY43_9FLAO|nr:hypothetical protein [Mesonia profundi]MDQ7916384.1 hypothetical protein [Mesonia profundi]